jgi:hypothetical protein
MYLLSCRFGRARALPLLFNTMTNVARRFRHQPASVVPLITQMNRGPDPIPVCRAKARSAGLS